MKLFPSMNILNKLETKSGLSKQTLKVVLITLLLALVIFGVSNYYNYYFKNILESLDSDEVTRAAEDAMNDAVDDTVASLRNNLESASEEIQYTMEKAIEENEDEASE